MALGADWRIFGYGGLALAILVWGLILYAAIAFRKRPGNETPRSMKTSNIPLELSWTIAPILVVTGLFIYTYKIENLVEFMKPNPAVQIEVNAFRWGWTFKYLGGPTINGTSTNPPQMVLPLGERAAIQVTSSDVDHAFWIPDMLFKRDAIPGRVTAFDLTPIKAGTFLGRCGEFCGLDHALMVFTVKVVPPAEYRHWLALEMHQR